MTNVVKKIKPTRAHQPDLHVHCGRRLTAFLSQLRERKVYRAAVVYMLATWLMLQLGEIIFPALQLPDWTLTLLLVLAVLQFPVAMVFAWLFDWTPDGVVIDAPKGSSPSASGIADCATYAALVLAAAALLLQLTWSDDADATAAASQQAALLEPATIFVRAFSKAHGAESGVAFGLEDEIRHQLLQSASGLIVSTLSDNARNPGQGSAAATLALEGTVYENSGQIRLLLQLIDLKTGRYLRSDFVEAGSATASEARKRLALRAAELVVGGTVVADKLPGPGSTVSQGFDTKYVSISAEKF